MICHGKKMILLSDVHNHFNGEHIKTYQCRVCNELKTSYGE